ncbi:MAG TPA: zf-HC2 domain-containing protein [Nitrolancea sp.]|nr:zf-HC2 domain-containing protein [Nitrolancea sp.]
MTDRPNNQEAGITEPVHPSDDELSAYLNRDVADLAARQRLEAHLETCAACRERLGELHTVVRLLGELENPVPKRSFRLDPSQIPAVRPAPEPVRIDPWIVRIQPSLRRLTAIAAVLLVVLVTADVLTHRESSQNGSREVAALSAESQATDSTSVMSAGAAESIEKSTAAAAQVPAATAASSSGGASGAGSSAEAPASTAASGGSSTTTSGSTAADAARTNEAETPAATAAALALQQTESSGQPPSETAPTSTSSTTGGHSYWRLVELAVGVVVIWLLVLTIVLPRMPRWRRS